PPYHHLGQVVGCASCDSLPQVHPGSALLPYTTLFRSTMAAIIEQHHDEKGIRWPVSVAPFHVVIVPVKYDDERQKEVAHELYERLKADGVEVVLDDRKERAGVKFNDADLIGFPWRITVGPRALNDNAVEVTSRDGRFSDMVPIAEAAAFVREQIAQALAQ